MHEKQRAFGAYLCAERELRQIPLSEVAEGTRVPLKSLELLEAGRWDELPAEIFVRGFVRSYARYIGVPEDEANHRYREVVVADMDAAARRLDLDEPWAPEEGTEVGGERKFGLALVVIIVLIIATITLSLLWRKGAGASSHSSLTSPPVPALHVSAPPPERLT